jgi:hypothetical protein
MLLRMLNPLHHLRNSRRATYEVRMLGVDERQFAVKERLDMSSRGRYTGLEQLLEGCQHPLAQSWEARQLWL